MMSLRSIVTSWERPCWARALGVMNALGLCNRGQEPRRQHFTLQYFVLQSPAHALHAEAVDWAIGTRGCDEKKSAGSSCRRPRALISRLRDVSRGGTRLISTGPKRGRTILDTSDGQEALELREMLVMVSARRRTPEVGGRIGLTLGAFSSSSNPLDSSS